MKDENNKPQIWISARLWQAHDSGVGYEWQFYNQKGQSVCKSAPNNDEEYFTTKRAAILSAYRFRSKLYLNLGKPHSFRSGIDSMDDVIPIFMSGENGGKLLFRKLRSGKIRIKKSKA